jgi:threonine aldolase
MNRDFRSDNTLGCSPETTEALVRASAGSMTAYGGDEITARVRQRCCDIFESVVDVYPVLTGTAGNALAISAMTPARIWCHEDAHILREEDGASELFSGGAIVAAGGTDGKIDPAALQLDADSCVSITQATEAGTLYSVDEMRAIGDRARRAGARVHVDGARFANALVALGCSAADLTWRAGVDILTFGGTKNGLLGAELLVVFRRELSEKLARLYHRTGHRLSKMRLLSSQLEAYLRDDLWLRNARHANAMAARVAAGLRERGVEIVRPVQANLVFAKLPQKLLDDGFLFYDWFLFGKGVYRIVTGFSTTEEDVDGLLAAL